METEEKEREAKRYQNKKGAAACDPKRGSWDRTRGVSRAVGFAVV